MPAWSELRAGKRLDSAARQLIVALDEARIRAVAHNREHLLAFTPGTGRFLHQHLDEHGARVSTPAADLPNGIIVADCTAPKDEVRYTPRGSAASFGTILLQDAGGRRQRVVISITGRVRMSRG